MGQWFGPEAFSRQLVPSAELSLLRKRWGVTMIIIHWVPRSLVGNLHQALNCSLQRKRWGATIIIMIGIVHCKIIVFNIICIKQFKIPQFYLPTRRISFGRLVEGIIVFSFELFIIVRLLTEIKFWGNWGSNPGLERLVHEPSRG